MVSQWPHVVNLHEDWHYSIEYDSTQPTLSWIDVTTIVNLTNEQAIELSNIKDWDMDWIQRYLSRYINFKKK